jgi:hypothetical protein
MIEDIRHKVAAGQYEYSRHAVDQTIKRRIAVHEVAEAITSQSMLIEDYPDDKYGPSCWYSASQRQVVRCISSAAILTGR